VFNEVQNTGRNLERLLRKKITGLCVHVALVPLHGGVKKLVLQRMQGFALEAKMTGF
jgi:hypothetical protein